MKKKLLNVVGAIVIMIVLVAIFFVIRDLQKNTRIGLQYDKIGVVSPLPGSLEDIIQSKFPNAELVYFNDTMDSILAVQTRQVDGAAATYPSVVYCIKYNQDLTFIKEPLTNDVSGIAVKKGNSDLLKQLDDCVTKFKNDGTLDDLEKRWYSFEDKDYEMVNITKVTEGIPLRVGVAANREPFCFLDENGDVTGIVGEMAYRIGEYLNRPIEFDDMKLSSLVPALDSGKVDLVIGITISEERKQFVDYTQPYIALPFYMIVRK